MRDRDVRQALHQHLGDLHGDDPDTVVVDELSVCGMVRVDVAVVNGALSAFELKSASDTLTRLPVQVEWYSRVMDHATLVVADRHRDRAVEMLRPWWGVIVATGDDRVTLTVDRLGGRNPEVDAGALVRFLWRDEALDALEERGLATGVRSKPKAAMWNRLATSLPLGELQDLVRRTLKGREGWRAAPGQVRDDGAWPTDATFPSSR